MGTSLAIAVLAQVVLAALLGSAVLGSPSALERLGAAYVLGWLGVLTGSVALSIVGQLGRGTMTGAATAMLGVALGAWLWRGRPNVLPPLRGAREALAHPIVLPLAICVAAALVYVLALGIFTTGNDWDGLTYHETRALLWDQQGRIGNVPEGNEPRLEGNPPLAELGLYAAMILPRSEALVALPAFVALLGCALAVALVARRLGLPPAEALYGTLVFTTLPIVLLHGSSILNDLLVASLLLGAAAFVLGPRRVDAALGALALGLALWTKFTAVLTLPLVVLVVVVGVPRSRLARSLGAVALGCVLAAPWYLYNLATTGALDAGLGDETGQEAERSLASIAGTLRALLFDLVDVSGFWGDEIVVGPIVGGVLVVAAIALWAMQVGRSWQLPLLFGGLLAASTPALLTGMERPARRAWRESFLALGSPGLADAHPQAWTVNRLPDTSLSWYGAAGAIVVVAGLICAVVAVRGGRLPPLAVVLAAAPLAIVGVFAFTITYDPWRGRLAMFPVGLACAAFGATLRTRWLAIGVSALCATTVVLSLMHSYTKPSGIGIYETPRRSSIWSADRVEGFTAVRDYDGTPEILRAVDQLVPLATPIAVAAARDTFLAPLAGPDLSRQLRLVPEGAEVPADARWLVVQGTAQARGCVANWAVRFSVEGWKLLERRQRTQCTEPAAL